MAKKGVDELVAKLKKNKYNKKCFTCSGGVSSYITTPHWIFVCDTCGGIMRETGFKVRGINMTSWSIEDLENIKQNGGNKAAKKQWLKGYDTDKHPLPNSNNQTKIRDFIREVFTEKKYARKGKSKKKSSRKSRAVSGTSAGSLPSFNNSSDSKRKSREAKQQTANGNNNNNNNFLIEFDIEEDEAPQQTNQGVDDNNDGIDFAEANGPSINQPTPQPDQPEGEESGAGGGGIISAFQPGVLDDLITGAADDSKDGSKAVDALASELKKLMQNFNLNPIQMEQVLSKAVLKVKQEHVAIQHQTNTSYDTNNDHKPTSIPQNGLIAPEMPEDLFAHAPRQQPQTQPYNPMHFPAAGQQQQHQHVQQQQPMQQPPIMHAYGAPSGPHANINPYQHQANPNPNPYSNQSAFSAINQGPQNEMRNPFEEANNDYYTPDPTRPNPFDIGGGGGAGGAQTTASPAFPPGGAAAFDAPNPAQQMQQPTNASSAPQKQDDIFAFADPFKN